MFTQLLFYPLILAFCQQLCSTILWFTNVILMMSTLHCSYTQIFIWLKFLTLIIGIIFYLSGYLSSFLSLLKLIQILLAFCNCIFIKYKEITNEYELQKGISRSHQLSKNSSMIWPVCMMNDTTCISVLTERVLMASDWNLSAFD